jgi:toxin ParE1/3/4
MRRLAYRPAPEADLNDIKNYIARDNSVRALSFIREVRVTCERLADMPAIGHRTDLRAGVLAFRHGSYLIFYRALPDGIEVVRVLHGARDLSRLL